MVWLSFLVVLRSVALSYVKEIKTVMDMKLGWGKVLCFSFIPVHEDLQNCDEHIALIEMKSALFGVCVLLSISVSEMKTFFSQMQVFFLY